MLERVEDLLDSIGVQGGVQVVKTLHPLTGFQVVRNHVLGKDSLHQQPVNKDGKKDSRKQTLTVSLLPCQGLSGESWPFDVLLSTQASMQQ